MKVKIRSRKAIEEMAANGFEKATALISITDVKEPPANLKNKPEFLLELKFEDIDNSIFEYGLYKEWLGDEDAELNNKTRPIYEEKLHMISESQALEIALFVNDIRDKVDVIICQCEAGKCRSSAIAAAILEHKYRKGIKVFADERYEPYKFVYHRIMNAFEKLKRERKNDEQ